VSTTPVTGLLSPNGLRARTFQVYLLLALRPVAFTDRPPTSCPNTLQRKSREWQCEHLTTRSKW
jgi:hypothetical protein